MTWVREAISDNTTKLASAARITMLMAGTTLSFCTVLLTFGSFWQIELVPALTAFGSVLGTMGGAAYVTQKVQDGKRNDTNA